MSVARYRTVAEFPTDQPLLLDLLTIWRPDDVAHMDYSAGWNTLMIDGSVRFRGDDATLEFVRLKLAQYPESASASSNWDQRFVPSLARLVSTP